ncbi:pilus assembly protein TadG-related protein [Celeribacter sp.]|uniref:TadE/TadG family type IV pilus assembly protein n=1 Tax=Celeribacter sp. TaxID=1890673 RepID=UPI003A930D06
MKQERRPFGRRLSLRHIHRRFARNEEGSFAIFSLFSILIIFVLAGIGVDLMRHEALRTELQGTLDRAVLAAANLDTNADAEEVVTDYFEKAGLGEYLNDVQQTGNGNQRTIYAEVKGIVPTFFLKLVGIETLELGTHAKAQQGITDLEIAMVLDVSGSMRDYSRISNLRSAGEKFSEIVFGNSDPDHIAVSVVPYSTQVNVGQDVLGAFDIDDAHNTSACINFEGQDFSSNGLYFKDNDDGRHYEQTMHFDPFYNRSYNSGLSLETCNPSSSNTALLFSRSESAVTNKIKNLTTDGNTSIDLGVKWGAAVLDPSNRPLGLHLATNNVVDQSMAGHPLNRSASNLKVMVVMTDGMNTNQYYIPDPYREGLSDLYIYNDRVSFPSSDRECYYSWGKKYCYDVEGYYVPQTGYFYEDEPYGGDKARQLTWAEVWSRFTVTSHANARRDANGNSNSTYNSWINKTRKSIGGTTKNTRLLTACQAAKDAGIIVFTIGFEAPNSSVTLLKECATSDSHYHDADGAQLSDVFASIATKVTELRLVQ